MAFQQSFGRSFLGAGSPDGPACYSIQLYPNLYDSNRLGLSNYQEEWTMMVSKGLSLNSDIIIVCRLLRVNGTDPIAICQ